MNIVICSSRSSTSTGLLKAWRMVSSLTPCFLALFATLGWITSYLAEPADWEAGVLARMLVDFDLNISLGDVDDDVRDLLGGFGFEIFSPLAAARS